MTKDIVETAMEEFSAGNHITAEKLLIQAAKDGNGHAAHNLATLYLTGGEGIDPDLDKAAMYFEQALASGFEDTIVNYPEWFKE